MAVKALVGNGSLLMRDYGVMAGLSVTINEGVVKNYLNEAEVTTNQVDTGLVFVEATRDTVSPSEVFLIPLLITSPHVVDTSGNGWIIARIVESVLDSELANAGGSDLVAVEKVTSLPSGNYVILATLASGVITDARTYSELSDYILKNPIFYDEDAGGTDSYAITVNGIVAYADGQEFAFKANTANTGASTLNVNSLGAKAIKLRTDADTSTGDIEAGSFVIVRYDADNDWFQMVTPSSLAPSTLTKASQAEAEAGTDDDKYMTSLKVRQAVTAFLFGEPLAGENVTISGGVPQAGFLSHGTSELDAYLSIDQSSENGSAIVNGANWDGQWFTMPSIDTAIAQLDIWMDKFGAPAGNFTISIYAFNGTAPTGGALYTSTVLASSISGTAQFKSYAVNTAGFTAGGLYCWVASCPSGDGSNNIRIYRTTTNPYSGGQRMSSSDSGANWTLQSTQDAKFRIYSYESQTAGRVYRSDQDHKNRSRFDGFFLETATAGVATKFQFDGIVDGFSGLTAGTDYSIPTTPGGVPAAGITYGYMGCAVSASSLMIEGKKDQLINKESIVAGATIYAPKDAKKAVFYLQGDNLQGIGEIIKDTAETTQTTILKTNADGTITMTWTLASHAITSTGAGSITNADINATVRFYK